MSPAVLRLWDVAKAFGGPTGETSVLDGVHLALAPGEKASLVGPSGSGKSTLLSIIAGLVRPDRGLVEIDGEDLGNLDDRRRAALRARRIGIALQADNLIPFLSARENVALAMAFGPGAPCDRGDELLALMGVGHRADHLPRQLSGGEAQRVALAVALANRPALLLADEVAAQLDVATAGHVVDAVFDTDVAVLFVTHDVHLADRAEQRLCLTNRRLVTR